MQGRSSFHLARGYHSNAAGIHFSVPFRSHSVQDACVQSCVLAMSVTEFACLLLFSCCAQAVQNSGLCESTLPTTMMVSAIGWSLKSGHVPRDQHVASCRLLDSMLRDCARTGRFKLLLRPRYLPGHFLGQWVRARVDKLRLSQASLVRAAVSVVFLQRTPSLRAHDPAAAPLPPELDMPAKRGSANERPVGRRSSGLEVLASSLLLLEVCKFSQLALKVNGMPILAQDGAKPWISSPCTDATLSSVLAFALDP